MSDMQGKTVVVTGATQGIGKETALALARMGARVFLTARDAARGEAVVNEIKTATKNDAVEMVLVDFAEMASIRAGAEDLRRRTSRIHVLVNNAGAIFMERQESKDGLELTFATNHIGYFLFTNLLLDVIKASAPARIVNVSSDAHRAARRGIDFDDLDRKKRYAGFVVYGESKLMNILFTRELARRLEGTGVTANCLHPGVIATGFGTNNRGLMGFATRVLSPIFLTTPAKGAATSIYLASSPEVAGVTGQYFSRCRVARTTRFGTDDAAAKRLWEISERIVAEHAARAVAA